jgi:hypothetical protein
MKKVFTRNTHGIVVKKCCASCAYKELSKADVLRYCVRHEKEVSSSGLCSLWEMSKQAQLAGWSQGQVKRKEYLMYLMEMRMEEQRQRDDGIKVRERKTETIRKAFEADSNTSIYVKI